MKFVGNLLTILTVIFMLWCGVSYGEILCKNTSPNPKYSKNNIIVNMIEWANNRYDYEN